MVSGVVERFELLLLKQNGAVLYWLVLAVVQCRSRQTTSFVCKCMDEQKSVRLVEDCLRSLLVFVRKKKRSAEIVDGVPSKLCILDRW